ncbi:MAG: CCA tRNA nucleotidyltransferase [Sphingomonas bacterium]|nr:CCA tRNA nucleotidyltransferase [Sphingomonas bacterium]
MKLDAGRWRERRGVARILDALGADEGLTRYVGGAVRDELLQIPVNDIDFATRLRPDQVVARLEAARIKAVPTGIAHGTITAVADGQPAEITTLRADVSTDGRRATVAFSDDWEADAARRDFTINALYADPHSGEIFDYFGGLDDIHARRVRFIGDPLQRIAEDHLRILRFFRFHARFGQGEPDPAALDACTLRANDLMALSRERIADETIKTLGLPNPVATVALMIARGIFTPVLPEIIDAARLAALVADEAAATIAPDAIRRLAALLPPDPAIADKVAARLKLSKKARKRLVAAADPDLGANPRALAYWAGSATAIDRLLLSRHPDDAAALADWPVPRLPISGGKLIKLGMTEGPAVATALKAIDRRWAEAGFPNGPAFDELVAEEVVRGGKG